jgi:hypothetical protein
MSGKFKWQYGLAKATDIFGNELGDFVHTNAFKTINGEPLIGTGTLSLLPLSGGNITGNLNVSGNLGIGTVAPTAKLEVVGNIALSGDNRTIINTSNAFLAFGTNNTERLKIGASGTVGINVGAFNPVNRLTVVTTSNTDQIQIRRNSTATNDSALLGFRISTGENAVNFAEIRAIKTDRVVTEDTDLSFFTRSNSSLTESLRIRDDGNVGIGTTNPTSKLHVVGDTRVEGNLTVNGSFTMVNTNVANTEQLSITNDGTGPAIVANQTGAQPVVDFQDDGVSAFYIADGGNIGIGTTSPASKITVLDSASNPRVFHSRVNPSVTGPGSHQILLGAYDTDTTNSGVALIARHNYSGALGNSFAIEMQPNASGARVERMRITSDGNISVGATSTSAQFYVKSNTLNKTPFILDTQASHTASLQEWKVNGSTVAYIEPDSALRIDTLRNRTTANNSTIGISDTGVIISRNIADSNPALAVNQVNSGSWGNIANFQLAGSTVASVAGDGSINIASGAKYRVNGGLIPAGDLAYDNTIIPEVSLRLASTTVQGAIDELELTKASISALSSNIILYPTTVASDISGYNVLVTSPGDANYDDTAVNVSTGTITTNDQIVGQLASSAGLFVGNPGVIAITTLGNIRKTGGNSNQFAAFYFKLFKRDSSGTEVLVATSDATAPVNPVDSSYREFSASAILNNGEFLSSDRIVIKYYASLVGASGSSYDFQFGGASPVRTLLPVPVSVIPISVGSGIVVTTTNFNGVLSASDDSVQKALDTLDDHNHDGRYVLLTNGSATELTVNNDAIEDVPLIVNGINGTTANIQEWRFNNGLIGRVLPSGSLYINGGYRGLGLYNSSNNDNSSVVVPNTGTVISRNVADANDALTVNLVHASSTGLILDAQAAGATKASIEKDGSVNTTARFKYGSNAYTEYNATDKSIDFVFAS